MRRLLLLAACAAPLGACITPPTPMAKAQEATQEFSVDLRYGRNEAALEKVAPSARDEFTAHHRAWGAGVRIAEVEITGMHLKGDRDVDVLVNVAWYRPDQQDLRATTIKQHWHDQNGWQLVKEERAEGDVGLLGETIVVERPAEAPVPAQFPTVRLRGGDGSGAAGGSEN
jgi:hypothetical protein